MKIIENTNLIKAEGYFSIKLVHEDGTIIKEYSEKNQIMENTANFFSRVVANRADFYSPPLSVDDFQIVTFALGTDGIDNEGNPKIIDSTRQMLFAEENFWNEGVSHTDADMKKYVYQITFEQGGNEGEEYQFEAPYYQNEGGTFPVDQNGNPLAYRDVINGTDKVKMTGSFKYENNILTFKFKLGQFAGNGCDDWTKAPTFSEAAFYMKRGATQSGNPLGSIFSMKTFPALPKTDSCSIEVEWILDFNVMK